MKFTLINHEKQTEEVIETPFTLKQWLSFHFGAWGFYKIVQINKKHYDILDSFSNVTVYTIKGGN